MCAGLTSPVLGSAFSCPSLAYTRELQLVPDINQHIFSLIECLIIPGSEEGAEIALLILSLGWGTCLSQ